DRHRGPRRGGRKPRARLLLRRRDAADPGGIDRRVGGRFETKPRAARRSIIPKRPLTFRPMPRSWAEFLGDAEGPYETEVARRGFASRLRESLSRSRRARTRELSVPAFDPDGPAPWERLVEGLLGAGVAGQAAPELVPRPPRRP